MVLAPEASKNTLCQQVHCVGKSPNLQKLQVEVPVLTRAHLQLQLLCKAAAQQVLGSSWCVAKRPFNSNVPTARFQFWDPPEPVERL